MDDRPEPLLPVDLGSRCCLLVGFALRGSIAAPVPGVVMSRASGHGLERLPMVSRCGGTHETYASQHGTAAAAAGRVAILEFTVGRGARPNRGTVVADPHRPRDSMPGTPHGEGCSCTREFHRNTLTRFLLSTFHNAAQPKCGDTLTAGRAAVPSFTAGSRAGRKRGRKIGGPGG